MNYLQRVCEVIADYQVEWDEAAKKDDSFFKTHLHYIKNYPIHCLLPQPLWRIIKKIVCSFGSRCMVCLALKWFCFGWLLTKLGLL